MIEVLIVGAGPVGLMTALGLAREGVSQIDGVGAFDRASRIHCYGISSSERQ
jgi:2-polyprenyl-6-methoxyphenol hydroxylase-like FAD-dependent oxidoreductase